MNAKADEHKSERITDICQLYRHALDRPGEIVISVDEMTGIQALERIAEDLPLGPKKPLAREFEYRRHGTKTLIGALNVASGEVTGICGDTRTEEDFVVAIEHFITVNPGHGVYHFVADQLNIHKSETLVRFVDKFCNTNKELGKKGKCAILESMQTREAFLCEPGKAIVFHYTPKHASWMNQIEIWFGILAKKVIRRGNFCSTDDLKEKILQFIDYFNATMAKPFKWTYEGKPLCL